MNIICLFRGHNWKFAYNHGIPLSCTWSYEEVEKKFNDGSIYEVYQCTRCCKQSRIVNAEGVRVTLLHSEEESP